MSRIGRKPITVPTGVEVTQTVNTVTIKGPKGVLSQTLKHGIEAKLVDRTLEVVSNGDLESRKFHGLYRALLENCVIGVTEGFKKDLIIHGVGYRCQVKGQQLEMNIGYCHSVTLQIPAGVGCVARTPTELEISGIDKHAVGQFASRIRKLRPPEPYKGKGIRYSDEVIRRKSGKAMA